MSAQNIKVTGECLCGEVTVQIDAAPLRMAQCHCRDCQKSSGCGHVSLAFFNQGEVKIAGELKSHAVTTDSGNTSTRNFCPKCGCQISGTNTMRSGIIRVPVGILDDRNWFKPEAVVYCQNRDEWDNTSEAIPNFDKMPTA